MLGLVRQSLVEVLQRTTISLVINTTRNTKRAKFINEVLFVDEHGFRHESNILTPRGGIFY